MKIIACPAIILAVGALAVSRAIGADFNGDRKDDIAIFSPADGIWAVRNLTRVYFGGSGDVPVPLDLKGNGTDAIATFRASDGLWAVRNVTRVYFGGAGDIPLGNGGSDPAALAFDYVVRAGDGADLLRALESTTYRSVFVPIGTYAVSATANVTYVRRIMGEGNFVSIDFSGANFLSIESDSCLVENIRVRYGGMPSYGNFYIDASNVTVWNCRSFSSADDAFVYSAASDQVSFDNCLANGSAGVGFLAAGSTPSSRLVNCTAENCATDGFSGCWNLSNCIVDGANDTARGFFGCYNLSSCYAYDANGSGFRQCSRIAACSVDGNAHTQYGFYICSNLSSCHVENCTDEEYKSSTLLDTSSCD